MRHTGRRSGKRGFLLTAPFCFQASCMTLSATFDKRFAAAADWLSTAVLAVDRFGSIVWCNSAAEVLLGCSRRNLRGTDLGLLAPQAREWVMRFKDDEKLTHFGAMTLLQRPLTEPETVYAVVSPFAGSDGIFLVEIAAVDHALKFAREEQEAGLSAATKVLLRNLAHEIKNPLGGIRGAAQLLESELASAEEREFTEVIISEADRLQSLVDRILAPYRRERRIGEVNVLEVLERVRNLLSAEFPKGLTILRDYDVSAPPIEGDKEQLIQVFLNLMKNAAQAMAHLIRAERAEITLKTRIARQVTIQRQICRTALRVDVIDNGPGIPEAIREKVFYPLVTGREEGTGLGLSLVKNYVEQNGGAIEVESGPGRTDFALLFPLGKH